MASPSEVFQVAVAHHRAGRLAEAAQHYRRVIEAEPRHASAMHLLGVVAFQTGHIDNAIELLTGAIRLEGSRAEFHATLGDVLRARGRAADAKTCYQRAISLDPAAAPAYYGLALLEYAAGEFAAAVECCRHAVAAKPDFAEAHNDLGNMLREQGQPAEAVACYARAVAARPYYLDALVNLAGMAREAKRLEEARDLLLRASTSHPGSAPVLSYLGDLDCQLERFAEAADWYRKALAIEPNVAKTRLRLGAALQGTGEIEAAIVEYQRALELDPSVAEAHYNLATAVELLGRTEEAVAGYEHALRLDPGYVNANVNLGAYYQDQGQYDLALAQYNRVLERRPDSSHAHYNRGLILLRSGNFSAGWPDYEWRLKLPKFPLEVMEESLWDGSDPLGRTILVHSEQGMGDTLHFIRYIPLLKVRYPRVVVRVYSAVVPLLRQSGFDVLGYEDPLPHFDLQIPLISLPRILGTTVDNIPAPIPYLSAGVEAVERWRNRLAHVEGFRIGICWQGSRANKSDEARSMPLSAFEPIARIAGVQLISLQKGEGLEQLDELRDSFAIRELGDDVDTTAGPFMDTAAVMKNLDLVLTADTSLAHLAGGLGVRTWIPLSTRADWRWLLDREDTPWYPTIRLFRQARYGKWSDVFERIATALGPLVDGR